ncbi:SDR family oxidoreductase [Streptomyces sp. NPDC102384]|uniref:SDR family oxidoreductase n=1 Tax=Streptomyces sp. NPDC102384 TaxID=3366166 RepID=UPI0037F82CE5
MHVHTSRFADKTVLITGGGSGMGLAAARRFLDEGARVALVGRNAERLEKAEVELDSEQRVLTVPADISTTSGADAVADAVRERFGTLDAVFANAGVGVFKRLGDFTEQDVEDVLAANVKGVFFTVQRALPLLNEGSAVVINASWTHHRGLAIGSLYAASKAAAGNLAKTLAADLAPHGVRVNAISPGYIDTDMYRESVPTEEGREAARRDVVCGRIGTPEEVASVVAFLASSDAAYVNGVDLLVDGGLSMSIPA